MGWKPEEEVDDEEISKALIRREELRTMACEFTTSYIEKGVENPHKKGWEAATYVFDELEKKAPFHEKA